MWGEGWLKTSYGGGGSWLKTSEYRHMGEGYKLLKNHPMIFESFLTWIGLIIDLAITLFYTGIVNFELRLAVPNF